MSLLCYPLFLLYKLLNMFRATMCPSSGADDSIVLWPRVDVVPWLQEGYQNRLAGSVSIEEFVAQLCYELLNGLTTRDVRCVHHGCHGTHRYDIQVLATHVSTWVHRYSSLLQWSVPLGQRGHVAMVGQILCKKCTLHNNQTYSCDIPTHKTTSHPERPFSCYIFSPHTLASPSGRYVN